MNIQKRNGDCTPPTDPGCTDCQDQDNATQKSINTQRILLCGVLYDSEGTLAQAQTKYDGQTDLLNEKKCMFIRTEENYRRYRNLDIIVGTGLLQTNDSLKANVATVNKLNTDLNKVLTDITKQIKDAKSKFADLKTAACKLDDSVIDKCNTAQWKAITGKANENCADGTTPPVNACKKAETEIYSLTCLPKGLGKDIDYIFQASADVTGIQIFSNIDTLDPLQKTLSDKSIAFEKLINDTMKTRKADLDKLQTDLVDSVKSITKSAIDRNSARSNFEGYYNATDYMCCPDCGCVKIPSNDANCTTGTDESKDKCGSRLQDCGQNICGICGDVKDAFCCDTPDNKDKKCD